MASGPSESITQSTQLDDSVVESSTTELPGAEARRRRSELRRSIAARLSLSKAPETDTLPASNLPVITTSPRIENTSAEALIPSLHAEIVKPRSTFGRTSAVPAPRPSLVLQTPPETTEPHVSGTLIL